MMTFLLELKDNINKFYNKHNVYLVPALKFVVAFISFLLLNVQIGYMTVLKNPLIALAVSIICAFLPSGFTVVALSIFMLAHLYAISAEFAVISLCIVLVMYLLYFRFAPKQGYILIFTVILCWCKIPEAIPVAVALGAGLTSFIPVSFGVIIYYIIKTASAYETAITNSSVADSMQQISYIVESFFNNKSCLIFVIAFTVAIIITYIIKRLSVDNAWTYAIAVGTVSEFIILIVGSLALNAKINIVDEGNGVYRQATADEAKATGFTSAKIVSDADGKVLVKGLDAGTYYLRETKAPEGYNKLLSDIKVEIKPVYDETTGKLTSYSVDYTYNGKTTNGAAITNKTDSPEVAVENKTGAQLPSTGSKGALMVTLAGIVLFGALTASKAFGKKKANN